MHGARERTSAMCPVAGDLVHRNFFERFDGEARLEKRSQSLAREEGVWDAGFVAVGGRIGFWIETRAGSESRIVHRSKRRVQYAARCEKLRAAWRFAAMISVVPC